MPCVLFESWLKFASPRTISASACAFVQEIFRRLLLFQLIPPPMLRLFTWPYSPPARLPRSAVVLHDASVQFGTRCPPPVPLVIVQPRTVPTPSLTPRNK